MPIVRAATPSDLTRLIDLALALGTEDGGQFGAAINPSWASEGGLESFTRALQTSTSCILVAEIDQSVVGALHGSVRPANTWRTAAIADIITLFVEPEVRNQRLGEALVDAFRSWAREQGAGRLAVSAFAANERAIRFYRRVGFQPYELVLEQEI